jgi:hypothetical protein
MTENDKYTLNDLISTSLEHKPNDFATVFNSLIVDKLETAISNKKLEIAQNIYGQDQEEENEEETE